MTAACVGSHLSFHECQGYPAGTLPLVREVGATTLQPAVHTHTRQHMMQWTPSATRADVAAMVARYVRLEFSIRSGAGRLVIDESRTSAKPKELTDSGIYADIDNLSLVEFSDAIRTLVIRRAVYAKPEAPQHLSTAAASDGQHKPLPRVAPLRDTAPIVKPKSHAGSGSLGQSSARDWRADVGKKIADAGAETLVEVETWRQQKLEITNQLEDVTRTVRRLRSGGRSTRNLKRHAEARAAELRSKSNHLTDKITEATRKPAYREAFDNLLDICTETTEVEAYCFGAPI